MFQQLWLNLAVELDAVYQHAEELIAQTYEISRHVGTHDGNSLLMMCQAETEINPAHEEDCLQFVVVSCKHCMMNYAEVRIENQQTTPMLMKSK